MLNIYLRNPDTHDAFFYDGDVAELFRHVRVIGEQVVFVELSPGHLINLAEVERIVENIEQNEVSPEFFGVPEDAPSTPATPIPGGPPSCPHGYISGTCTRKDAYTDERCTSAPVYDDEG